ncbi:hypothetical protein D3C81_2001940 [compost metagenome]
MYITAEENGNFIDQDIIIKDNSDTTKDLTQAGFLEGSIYLPSTKVIISGGTVSFDDKGVLESISIVAGTEHPATDPLEFTGEEVLKQ